ncbi:Ni-sirohydrochlorin a,c-diamide reductive cyclase catalytic subunit [Methanosphaera sp. ISO3-F5]|uniref:Ni-sirohydrochlorin a,c-diamide reductive cyclase catalytic subunit n=1 Tax=Methanosphaera sp. ISO3-F5 TaxID=1452353 RepID=UPI002B25DA24|nr:Ni-sirohydrochlorin a,c-diamide reductive cyclase catalytic subunit [Methanosphaera sp. ISO3-F5]WQH65245.1 Ni-sirohydrochlorin a,c-diamide reductive cyclase catalytic subunit [Methanosphaera sp. ISO3-F5]
MHPRPSPIAAALYTLRDLEVDVIIMHGPAGCCFRTGRLLEDEGIRVITTAMNENDFIFGAGEKLVETIREVEETFHPETIGIVGTCASMIIGENMKNNAQEAGINANIIIVETHGGYEAGDNTAGAIQALKAANTAGIISQEEVDRQSEMLQKATELEKTRGMAKGTYIQPDYGDNKVTIAKKVINTIKEGKKVAIVLNAKKETSYLFADIMTINWTKHSPENQPIIIANTDENIGLPYIKHHAQTVNNTIYKKPDHITGGLDEYPVTGIKAEEILNNIKPDLTIILGVPHAVEVTNVPGETIAVTDGPRLVEPLRQMGFDNVVTELDAHSKTLGAKSIVESEFAQTIRGLLE